MMVEGFLIDYKYVTKSGNNFINLLVYVPKLWAEKILFRKFLEEKIPDNLDHSTK